ncbi:hypothetical protein LCGC14_1764100 [marine sediment metagenome]|uniref:TRASH domain-containing protein n=1 Tax=marine sediment metagenome TaxID=412755 RepID=A0A0F9HMN0_9ZZZZ
MSKEKSKICPLEKCKRVLRRVNWYYRNGLFFCNKKCFKKYQKSAKGTDG